MNIFDEYTGRYDMNIKENNYKYHHSYRVMDNMIILAKNLNLPYSDIELAKCIGLLHDIGRFEQYKRFKSFDDINIDHGDLGEQILKEENILSHFNISKDDYETVYTAIRNHNKYMIEDGLTKREMLFAKLIRDADKLDILYAIGNQEIKSIIHEDDSEINNYIKETFFKNKPVKLLGKESKNDHLVVMFSFAYDFNFNISLDIIKNKQYYDKIYDRLHDKQKFKPYIEHIIKYINERTD